MNLLMHLPNDLFHHVMTFYNPLSKTARLIKAENTFVKDFVKRQLLNGYFFISIFEDNSDLRQYVSLQYLVTHFPRFTVPGDFERLLTRVRMSVTQKIVDEAVEDLVLLPMIFLLQYPY